MPEQFNLINALWVLFSATLVLLMQAGFLCLEAGMMRRKNAINVAMKNVADFMIALFVFWAIGFGLMFGHSQGGWIGGSLLAPDFSATDPWTAVFFVFQVMFVATAATIVSGAISERVSYASYGLITLLVVIWIYPLAGHWAWGGALDGPPGWLAGLGFVDFAGSTVVHSVGGWVALAAILHVGPRIGRFTEEGPQRIPPSSVPLALLGMLFFVIGWIGFNGGSELALDQEVPRIIAHTLLAAAAGGITAHLLARYWLPDYVDNLLLPINGVIAGLVAITAGVHAVSTLAAVIIGAMGAVVMVLADFWMIRRRLDDAVAAVPVHLAAGIWGTLAVAIFGDLEKLGTGLDRWAQLQVQALGIVAIGATTFILAWIALAVINRIHPLRVSAESEQDGLNVSEHGQRTDLTDLMTAMDNQARSTDLSARVPVEPFTEVGLIARRYNQVMEALEQAVTHTRIIVRDIADGLVTFDRAGIVLSANPSAGRMLARSTEELIGRPLNEMLDGARFEQGSIPDLTRQGVHRLEGQFDETFRHLELRISRSGDEQNLFYTAMLQDLTEKHRYEEQLHRERELAQVTLESIVDAVITTDEAGRVRFLNANASALCGLDEETARGRPLCRLFRFADENHPVQCSEALDQLMRQKKILSGVETWTLIDPADQRHTVQFTAAPIFDRARRLVGGVLVLHDITEARALEEQLSYQARHDVLTGLLNRREFEARLASAITSARHGGQTHMLCYIDLDQFKIVNDTCGHLAGDELLRQVSRLLQEQLRGEDIIARLGGDEFGVIFTDCGVEEGLEIANRLREEVRAFRFPWEDKQFGIGASIGLVRLDADCEGLAEVMGQADSACYASKDHGRNRVHLFESSDADLASRRGQMQWVQRIRDALDHDRFRLYFQSIVPAADPKAQATHYEIFVRILDDEDNLIPPGAFIPSAERYGLMTEVDEWVVRNTLAWMGDMQRTHPDSPRICAINLSGPSLGKPEFLERIQTLIAHHDVRAESICFEITETAAIANIKAAKSFIETLRAAGCTFALDDFGSGLSSFGYLRNLPVQYLKIDGSFVKDICESGIDEAMVRSIHSIGEVMGLKTIAEFVDSAETVERLAQIGVDYVQGYHIDRPRPLEQLDGVAFMPR
ncbi:MAG: ammonium transporter [Halothiobacillaceae bacterium]